MTTLNRIGVLAHPARPYTAPIAVEITEMLRARGIDTWLFTEWDKEDVRATLDGTDMVIAIGGDGAMLHSASVCAPYNVPVLGLNMGHLGFLTEIKGPETWPAHMDEVLAGRYWIEQRMMIHIEVWRGDACLAEAEALNDAVVGRGHVTKTVHLDAYIDREWTTTYSADAVIISTATGSTAYALASGGPILPPELRNMLIVPVAPHLSLDRPIILPEGASVEVVVAASTTADVMLNADGEKLCDLLPGDRVCVQASQHVSRFVRLRERNYFYRSLLDRLEPRMPAPPTPERRQI